MLTVQRCEIVVHRRDQIVTRYCGRWHEVPCQYGFVLVHDGSWVPAATVYDGDVVLHPFSRHIVTVVGMLQLEPLTMLCVSGVAEFDPDDNDAANELLNGRVDELRLESGRMVFRRWRYSAASSE